jgi:hypothetical protein
MSTFSVGDKIKYNGNTGSKTSTPIVGSKILVNGKYGHYSNNFNVGDRIWIDKGFNKDYGYKSKYIIPVPDYTCDRWSGYGDYMWQHICVRSVATRDDLGIWVVKRVNNSDDLSINDVWQIKADDLDVTYSSLTEKYTWNEPLLANNSTEVGIMCTDSITYMFNLNTIYNFDMETGEYSVKGSLPSNTYPVAFDGTSIFARKYANKIYRFRFSDLTAMATLDGGSGSNVYIPPIFISGSNVWFTQYMIGSGPNGNMEKRNYSDLTSTGVSYSNGVYQYDNFPQVNSGSGVKYWFNGFSDTYPSPHTGWKTWDIGTGVTSNTITIESPY